MKKAEKFIKDCKKHCSNELCAVEDKYGKKVISYHEWLTPEQALRAVEIEKEEVIDKARKYYNEKNLEVELGLLNEFSHVDYWEHKGSSKSDKELEGEEPKLQVVDFDKLLQWEKEKLINKACVWLSIVPIEDMEHKYNNFNTSEGWYKFIEDFTKFMNEDS